MILALIGDKNGDGSVPMTYNIWHIISHHFPNDFMAMNGGPYRAQVSPKLLVSFAEWWVSSWLGSWLLDRFLPHVSSSSGEIVYAWIYLGEPKFEWFTRHIVLTSVFL